MTEKCAASIFPDVFGPCSGEVVEVMFPMLNEDCDAIEVARCEGHESQSRQLLELLAYELSRMSDEERRERGFPERREAP